MQGAGRSDIDGGNPIPDAVAALLQPELRSGLPSSRLPAARGTVRADYWTGEWTGRMRAFSGRTSRPARRCMARITESSDAPLKGVRSLAVAKQVSALHWTLMSREAHP